MASTTKLTIDDYEALPDELAVGHELVDGELVDVSGNTPKHNAIRDLLIALLLPLVRERRLGRVFAEQEYDFEGNAHGPDVTFFGAAKEHLLDLERRVQRFVPDLAVEIVSPNDPFRTLVIVALASNAVEHAVGIRFAMKARPDYALSTILNSSLQVALLLTPVLVLISRLVGPTHLTLVFPPLQVAAVAIATIVALLVVYDGEYVWLEGVALIGLYGVIVVAFWWG